MTDTNPSVSSGQTSELSLLTGHSNDVVSLSFSPSGRLLASASYDGSVIIWDVKTGDMLRRLSGHQDSPQQVLLPSDERCICCAFEDVSVWDVRTGAVLYSTNALVGIITVSPDGKYVAGQTWDPERPVVVLKIMEDHIERVLRLPEGSSVNDISFSSDGRLLAVLDRLKICIFSLHSGRELRSLVVPERECCSELVEAPNLQMIMFSPDGQLLVSGCADSVKLWCVHTGEYIGAAHVTDLAVGAIAFSPDGEVLAASDDRQILLWKTSTLDLWKTVAVKGARAVAFSSDGQLLAGVGDDRRICLWSIETGELIWKTVGQSYGVMSVESMADGDLAVSQHSDGTTRVWSTSDGVLEKTCAITLRQPHELAVSPDGRYFIAAIDMGRSCWQGPSNEVGLRITNTGEMLHTFCVKDREGNVEEIVSAVFSADGRMIALGHLGFTVSLWDAVTGELIGKKRTYMDSVGVVTFSPDGRTLAIGTDYDEKVELFSVPSLRRKRTLIGHTARVTDLTFLPNGKILASSSSDGTVRLWDTKNGRLIRTLLVLPPEHEHDISMEWITYTPEGEWCGCLDRRWLLGE